VLKKVVVLGASGNPASHQCVGKTTSAASSSSELAGGTMSRDGALPANMLLGQ
jgi:hypothetical protein